jgi:hypothetical protein
MSSFDKLRYSFDNLLRELDDICKSIDDLTDIDQIAQTTDLLPPGAQDQAADTNSIAKNQLLDLNLHRINNRLLKNKDSNKKNNNNINKNEADVYELYKNNIISPSIPISKQNNKNSNTLPFKLGNFNMKKKNNAACSSATNLNDRKNNKNDSVFNNNSTIRGEQNFSFKRPNLVESFNNSLNFYKSKRGQKNQEEEELENDNFHQGVEEEKEAREILVKSKKKKLPKSLYSIPSLNTMIGSAQETAKFFFKSKTTLPIATQQSQNKNDYYVKNDDENFSSSLKNSYNLLNNQDLVFQNDSEILFDQDPYNYGDVDQQQQQMLDHLHFHGDRLNFSEISQIECFYNSMGCYVYVARSTAELYQIKKEDEFDSVDQDPVKEYHEFLMRKKEAAKGCSISGTSHINHQKVNYMYINSGVPVIVFNYGVNPKRKKDLRILIAERSTGFCMFEFKFDCLTQLSDSNPEFASDPMTLVQLKLNENTHADHLNPLLSHHVSATTHHQSGQLSYHNEYFERFFSSKNRHAHKEHLLKFILKKDCEEFCSQIMQIISDKRNLNLFTSEYLSINSANLSSMVLKQQNNLMSKMDLVGSLSSFLSTSSKSSVIVCHFLEQQDNTKRSNFSRDDSGYSLSTTATESGTKQPASIMKNYNSTMTLNKLNTAVGRRMNFQKNRKNNLSYDVAYLHQPQTSNINNTFDNFSVLNPFQDESRGAGGDATNRQIGAIGGAGNFSLKSNSNSFLDLMNNFGQHHSTTGGIGGSLAKTKDGQTKLRKLKKSDISSPVSFSHVTHLDKPVPIGKRYKVNY